MLLKKNLIFAILGLYSSIVYSMDMDEETENTELDLSSKNETVELIPIPHEMKHPHGLPILQTDLTPAERLYWENYNTTTYFTIDSNHKSALWYHIISLLACFGFLYPVSLILNNVKSKWYIPVLTANNVVLVSSLISLKVFGSSVPDLYPNNAYAKMSWILLFASLTHYVIALLYCASKWVSGEWESVAEDEFQQPFIPLEDLDIERGANLTTPPASPPASTLIDSDRGFDSRIQSLRQGSPETVYNKDSLDLEGTDTNTIDRSAFDSPNTFYKPKASANKTTSITRDDLLGKIFQNKFVKSVSEKSQTLVAVLFTCFNIPLFIYLFIYIVTGVTVGTLLAQSNHVFNVLAHFIKGGVFVSLGVFALARYCGCLYKSGLAWNKAVVFKNQVNTTSFWYRWTPHGMITMEGYESFLIFFYGITNVFLEHLASPGGAWDAKDLQHASIAFMYIGSGLCGLITEHIISEWRYNQVLANTNINPDAIHAGTPGYSPNPFPVFTIFWTGILMSQHKQASQTSTMIHMQWGYLLSFGSFFRLLTFILLMLVPNKNLNPARPFPELITSFCLICGGFIFMQSNDQTVESLEYRGLTGMFTLNVNVGIVALIMAWEMSLLIWKSRIQSKKQI